MPKQKVRPLLREEQVANVIRHICTQTRIQTISDYSLRPDDSESVWPGIVIDQGNLIINPNVCHAGDLLHEAGHIATTPLILRPLLQGDLGKGELYESFSEEREHLIKKDERMLYVTEGAAIAWSILSCLELDLDVYLAFENGFNPDPFVCREQADVARFSIGSPMGGSYTVQLYYLGMLAKKSDSKPIAWDFDYLPLKGDRL